ncbi:unnamed protein product [Rotaria socialis]|uniref:Uncharacterized protein n=1 Tax=Rotaria socialis TaxID=392032 RepID=A0A817ZZ95_9BILA|nr:unnamed protein product [Rotaria socialis]CAF3299789.1 unnamed protein product [Rotaria socialis]CAF3397201.1 unnamed protein product [Rotaria socialis]CAF4403660.1 unnamed protein product [Rotaria socialis]CAF4468241.1 unnamed protein product [Rotaria socialis]
MRSTPKEQEKLRVQDQNQRLSKMEEGIKELIEIVSKALGQRQQQTLPPIQINNRQQAIQCYPQTPMQSHHPPPPIQPYYQPPPIQCYQQPPIQPYYQPPPIQCYQQPPMQPHHQLPPIQPYYQPPPVQCYTQPYYQPLPQSPWYPQPLIQVIQYNYQPQQHFF